MDPNEGKHAVRSHWFQALHVNAEVGTCVLDVAEKPPNAGRPHEWACEGGDLIVELHVVGAAGEVRVDVPLVYRRNRSLDDLEVLLRHPRQVSRRLLGRAMVAGSLSAAIGSLAR